MVLSKDTEVTEGQSNTGFGPEFLVNPELPMKSTATSAVQVSGKRTLYSTTESVFCLSGWSVFYRQFFYYLIKLTESPHYHL